jgi:WD40 repeat protein
MKSTRHRLAPRVALALCVLAACAPAPRAQESAAPPPVRLVAALEEYEGPSRFGARPALAAFSPDGRTLALSGAGRTVKLYDAETGRLLLTLAHPKKGEGFNGFAFAPDSRTGATRSSADRSVSLWDLTTGRLLFNLAGRERDLETKFKAPTTPSEEFVAVPLSPDGRLVAAWVEEDDKEEVRIWDASDGRTLATLKKNKSKLLAFSHDGRTLAAAGGDKRSAAQLWDATTGQLKHSLAKVEGGARTLAFSPDGRHLVTTSGKGVRLWDAETGQLITTLDRARFPAHFSPDGRRLVTGGTDKTAYLYEISAK